MLPVLVMGVIFWILFKYKKNEPLTYAEFLLKDMNGQFIHILGARRVMPEQGDSFDIFEHYLFDLQQMKMIKGDSQRGKTLDLKSEFVKRSMDRLSAMKGCRLAFEWPKEGHDVERDDLLKVYRFDEVQSDTEVFEPIHPDCMVFIDRGDDGDHFLLNIYRNGNKLATHQMKGMSDYFFKTIYLPERSWVCFLYRKQNMALRSGMALCILNYDSGEMIYDGFVKPDKP